MTDEPKPKPMTNAAAATAGAVGGSGTTILSVGGFKWVEQMLMEGRYIEAPEAAIAMIFALVGFIVTLIYWWAKRKGVTLPPLGKIDQFQPKKASDDPS